MKRLPLILVLFLLSPILSAQQPVLVEQVKRNGTELTIPYSKYKLSNGLTLIIHEDHSDPIVHVDVTYHVGSAREEPGKSGFAHFFEHMMFQGSDHVADEQHFKLVTEAGGTMNGSTNMDRTNYFQTVPKNQLERVMWLEADRMGFLLDAVTQQKFEVQRSTVKNERGQRYDNRPYGLVREKVNQALYPFGHPYSWPTIGYLEDLNRVDVNDLKKFFLRWYGPNNAVITVAGDVNPAEVLSLVNKYFGSIPPGPEVKDMEPQVPQLSADRYISYEDNIRFPMVTFSWPTVPAGHKDEAALEALAYWLGESKSSPLHQRFEKAGKAMNASSWNYGQELSGTFGVNLTLLPGIMPADAAKSVSNILDSLSKSTLSKEELNRFILQQEVNMYRWLESVGGKAGLLAHYETMFDNPNQIGNRLKAYQALTPQRVSEVLQKYIAGKPAVIMSVYPKKQPELVVAADNFTPKLPQPAGSDAAGEVNYQKAKDTFDRSKMPAAGEAPIVNVPEFWNVNFKGKSKAIGTTVNESPTVSAVLYFPAGHVFEPTDKAGLAELTARMLNQGTEKSTAEAIEARLENLGSSITFRASDDHIYMHLFTLKKNLDSTIAIAREMIFQPRFDEEDFNREKKKTLEGISNRTTQPATIASLVFDQLVYGKDVIHGLPAGGTAETVGSITLDDVIRYHAKMVSKATPHLVLVGDITAARTQSSFTFLDQFTAAPPVPPQPSTEATPQPTYLFVHRPEAAQSEIRVGYLALPYDATGDYYKATILNYPLGGSFNSRINLNLREDKGYTYGIRGYFNGGLYPGPYRIATGVRTDATDSALTEIMSELKMYYEQGISPEELAFTQSSMTLSEALKYETPWQKAGFLNHLYTYGLKPDYRAKQQAILNAIRAEELNADIKKHLNPSAMHIVIVGDREKVLEPLKKAGFEFTEVDENGNPL